MLVHLVERKRIFTFLNKELWVELREPTFLLHRVQLIYIVIFLFLRFNSSPVDMLAWQGLYVLKASNFYIFYGNHGF
jgi:hypothetical protein